jgi:hypothetical protein
LLIFPKNLANVIKDKHQLSLLVKDDVSTSVIEHRLMAELDKGSFDNLPLPGGPGHSAWLGAQALPQGELSYNPLALPDN